MFKKIFIAFLLGLSLTTPLLKTNYSNNSISENIHSIGNFTKNNNFSNKNSINNLSTTDQTKDSVTALTNNNNCGVGLYTLISNFYNNLKENPNKNYNDGIHSYLGKDFNIIFPGASGGEMSLTDFANNISVIWAKIFTNTYLTAPVTAKVTILPYTQSGKENKNAINLYGNIGGVDTLFTTDIPNPPPKNDNGWVFNSLLFAMSYYLDQQLTAVDSSKLNPKDFLYAQMFADFMWTIVPTSQSILPETYTHILTAADNDKKIDFVNSIVYDFLFNIIWSTPDIDSAVMAQKLFATYFNSFYTTDPRYEFPIKNNDSYTFNVSKLGTNFSLNDLTNSSIKEYGIFTKGQGYAYLAPSINMAYNNTDYDFSLFVYNNLIINTDASATIGGHIQNLLALQTANGFNPNSKDGTRVVTNTTASAKDIKKFLFNTQQLVYLMVINNIGNNYIYLYKNFNPFLSTIQSYNKTKFNISNVYYILLYVAIAILIFIILMFLIWKSYDYYKYKIKWEKTHPHNR